MTTAKIHTGFHPRLPVADSCSSLKAQRKYYDDTTREGSTPDWDSVGIKALDDTPSSSR